MIRSLAYDLRWRGTGDIMSVSADTCIRLMEAIAPPEYALAWDNSGLQVGSRTAAVDKIMVALTVTENAADRAIADGIDLIIAHHPLIFRPLPSIDTDLPIGRIIKKLLQNEIVVYACHTNLDRAQFGLNYWLAESLQLRSHKILEPEPNQELGLGRIGYHDPVPLRDLAARLKEKWQTQVRYVGEPHKQCRKIAVCGGSGSDLIHTAWSQQADVLITGDLDYHTALDAEALGLAVIDAGHFATEKIMIGRVASYLRTKLPTVTVVELWEGEDPFRY
ncbi:MAG: Nif3-like dinuclear metal center hexameric protein [Firmicutes bacterium]|nr:Nif3-like dinuclear metal center hexameric protein [Bacillota bacterium]NLL88698.1 Nif3-like dinuclear metal center hexameric protein [Bacillota bacterium]